MRRCSLAILGLAVMGLLGCSAEALRTGQLATDGRNANGAALANDQGVCGNAIVEAGEECDDGRDHPLDGCDATCRRVPILVLSSLELAIDGSRGCDLNGDGQTDRKLNEALGSSVASLVNAAVLSPTLRRSRQVVLVSLPSELASDVLNPLEKVSLGWMLGRDADGDANNNWDGQGVFVVDPTTLNAVGSPEVVSAAQGSSGRLETSETDLGIGVLGNSTTPVSLRRAKLNFELQRQDATIINIASGMLCGVIRVADLATVPMSLLNLPFRPACTPGVEPSLADLAIAGGEIRVKVGGSEVPVTLPGSKPDVDLAGGGSWTFTPTFPGLGCQRLISACMSPEGRSYSRSECFGPAAGGAQGFSTALNFKTAAARLAP